MTALENPKVKRVVSLARRTGKEVVNDNLVTMAGSVAFFGVLALFPALIAIVSVYGLISNPEDVVTQVRQFGAALPESARSLIEGQLTGIARSSGTGLTLSLVGSLLLSLWSAASGVDAVMEGVNSAYDLKETRSYFKRKWIAVRFTLALSAFVVVAIASITTLPPLVEHFLGLGSQAATLISVLRWPALAVAVLLGLSELYRLAPNRPPPKTRQLLPGSVLGTVVWLVASLLFSVYASSFGRFNKTYGVFAGFVILLFWLYVSAMAILIGAELNAELESDRHEGAGASPFPQRRAS